MDPIANFLTQIRNAYLARHPRVVAPHSRIKHQLATLLSQAGFIGPITQTGVAPHLKLEFPLIYQDNHPVLTGLKRISHPSARSYIDSKHIPRPLSGRGLTILTTSKGLMTDRQAKQANIGGEIICQVW